MTAEEIRKRLAPLSWAELKELADDAGLPFHTIRKIASGETTDPRSSTVEALSEYFGS